MQTPVMLLKFRHQTTTKTLEKNKKDFLKMYITERRIGWNDKGCDNQIEMRRHKRENAGERVW